MVVKFNAAAVRFGDPKAPAPLNLSCSDAAATQGTGRWTSEREWVFDFDNDLPPGVRLQVSGIDTLPAGLKVQDVQVMLRVKTSAA